MAEARGAELLDTVPQVPAPHADCARGQVKPYGAGQPAAIRQWADDDEGTQSFSFSVVPFRP
jgi:hypothetical protein